MVKLARPSLTQRMLIGLGWFLVASSSLAKDFSPPIKSRDRSKHPPHKQPTASAVGEPSGTLSNGHEQDFFWNAELFFDLAGPVQYQTFAQSEVSGEQKYDPNLLTYGVATFFLWPTEWFDHGPVGLVRMSREFQNTIYTSYDGETATRARHVSVRSLGYGGGYMIRRKLYKAEFWCPSLAVRFERSDVFVGVHDESSAASPGQSYDVASTLMATYAVLGNHWYLSQAGWPWGFGLHFYVPLSGALSDNADSAFKVKIIDGLDHRMSRGIGLSGVVGVWF